MSTTAPIQSDNRLENGKLLVMFVACAVAALGQFYPGPLSNTKVAVSACVATYFVLSGLLQYFITFVEKDIIFRSKPLTAGQQSSALTVHASMGRYSDKYTLQAVIGGAAGPSFTGSVGSFFSERGEFAEGAFREELQKSFLPQLLQSLGKKQK